MLGFADYDAEASEMDGNTGAMSMGDTEGKGSYEEKYE